MVAQNNTKQRNQLTLPTTAKISLRDYLVPNSKGLPSIPDSQLQLPEFEGGGLMTAEIWAGSGATTVPPSPKWNSKQAEEGKTEHAKSRGKEAMDTTDSRNEKQGLGSSNKEDNTMR